MVQDLNFFVDSVWPGNASDAKRLDQVYVAWKSLWQGEFERLGESFCSEEFLKAKSVASIWHKDEIAALHLYDHHYLASQAHREQSYLSESLSIEYVEELLKRGHQTALSLQYLSVMPNYQKNKEISFAKLMLGLSFKNFENTPDIDICVGVTRDLKSVNQMVSDYGVEFYKTGVYRHGELSSLPMVTRDQLRKSPDFKVRRWVDELWEGHFAKSLQKKVA